MLTMYNVLFFSFFSVPETLDRKLFHQEGMCVHTSSVKGPPQVCACAPVVRLVARAMETV